MIPPNQTRDPSDDPEDSLPEGSPSSPTERLSGLVGGNAGFALRLHGELAAAADGGNVFASPYSVSMALAMTDAGGAQG